MRKTTGFLAAALPALLSACASAPGPAVPPLEADASRIASGGHCESSAMLNALLAAGYDFTEAEIIGYGAAPSFVYVPGRFPFIGARSATMRETFFETAGIAWERRAPGPGREAWAEVYETLGRGIPVMLRVDMRYLPYRYGGKYGPAYMSFGWHWVTLFKADRRRGLAWVTDTEYRGLQEIRIADLDRARASRTKVWPPNREFAWVVPAAGKGPFDRAGMVRAAAAAAASNLSGSAFESLSAGLPELERFPSTVAAFDRELPPYLFSAALAYMGDTIEKHGTGGAAFRTLYASWLESEAARIPDAALAGRVGAAAEAARAAEGAWHGLSAAFVRAAAAGARTAADRTRLAAACAEAAGEVLAAERRMAAAIARAAAE